MKNVLITGASGNLGKAAVAKFLALDYMVIAIVSPGKKLPFETTDNVATFEADLTDEQSVSGTMARIHERYQNIDAALLLVGGFSEATIFNTDGSLLKKMMSINFDTSFLIAKSVFTKMINQSDGGRIVFIGARPALVAAEGKGLLAYALSKSLIFKFAEYLNAEGKQKNVLSCVIVPGTIDTPANRKTNPGVDYSKWVTPTAIAEKMASIANEKSAALKETVFKVYGDS